MCRAGGKEKWEWNSEPAPHLVGKQGCAGWREQEKVLQKDTPAISAARVSVDGGQVDSLEVIGTLCRRNLVEWQGPAFREVGMRWKMRKSACPVHLLSCSWEQGTHPPAATGRRGRYFLWWLPLKRMAPRCWRKTVLANTVRKLKGDERGRE